MGAVWVNRRLRVLYQALDKGQVEQMKIGDLVEHKIFERLDFGVVVETGSMHVTVLWTVSSKRATEAVSLVRLVNESS